MKSARNLILAAAVVLGLTSHSTESRARTFNLFSTQQDIELGRQSAAQIERQIPILDGGASERLVQRLGQRLAASAPGARFPYQFRVVNLSDVNAFALPGGYVYIHRGLIERVQTEGQLAGVMAHEIAHVALRHPTKNLSRAYAIQAGAGALTGLLGRDNTRTRQVLNTVGGVGLNLLFLRFSRSAESEADRAGAEIMARAGYDPQEMADFFAILRQDSGRDPSKVAVFLSDHPSPSSREATIRNASAQLGPVRSHYSVGGLRAAQQELRSLPPAPRMSQVAPRSS